MIFDKTMEQNDNFFRQLSIISEVLKLKITMLFTAFHLIDTVKYLKVSLKTIENQGHCCCP